MSLGLRLSFDILTGKWAAQMHATSVVMAKAATGAMDEVVSIVKPESRAEIAAAGLSRRWQNALRVTRYPNRKGAFAMDPAVYVFHKIEYAGVFADGALIKGSPWLWLPLSNIPKSFGGQMTRPERVAAILGGTSKLVPMQAPGKPPLLGAELRLSRTAAGAAEPKVTLAALKRGNSQGTGVLRTIPLFVGIREVNIHKKLDIAGVCQRARDRIPALYAQHIAVALNA